MTSKTNDFIFMWGASVFIVALILTLPFIADIIDVQTFVLSSLVVGSILLMYYYTDELSKFDKSAYAYVIPIFALSMLAIGLPIGAIPSLILKQDMVALLAFIIATAITAGSYNYLLVTYEREKEEKEIEQADTKKSEQGGVEMGGKTELVCAKCGKPLTGCKECGDSFEHNEKILCDKDRVGSHYCLDCVDEDNCEPDEFTKAVKKLSIERITAQIKDAIKLDNAKEKLIWIPIALTVAVLAVVNWDKIIGFFKNIPNDIAKIHKKTVKRRQRRTTKKIVKSRKGK